MVKFAERFKELREEKGGKPNSLTNELGVNSRTISSYEVSAEESLIFKC
ncbi:MAG: hypothetical protein FWC11_06770 [Firmicutes bacterium]|nr:hypothetical protein [Bacillota bacterium]MCL2256528.1 hypothetical protein [Bacillota bacterium]